MVLKNIEDFCDEIIESDLETIFVGDYYLVSAILKTLIQYDYDINSILLLNPEDSGYLNELILEIHNDYCVDIYPAECEGYIKLDADDNCIVYVMEDVNSAFWKLNSDCNLVEVDYYEGEEPTVTCSDHSVSRTWFSEDGKSCYTESFTSTNKELIKKIIKEWNEDVL